MEQKLYDAASRLPGTELEFAAIATAAAQKPAKRIYRAVASLAACVLLLTVGLVTAEARAYTHAVAFFEEYDLPTEGLSRSQIKAVYRDITTKSFTYAKTAEVLASSLSDDRIGGYEILQENPTPEDVEKLWNGMHHNGELQYQGESGIRYQFYSEYKLDPQLGFDVHDKSFLEKYDGETLLWSVSVSEFWIEGYSAVSDGVIAYGQTATWSSEQDSYAWMAKIDASGNLLWKRMLNNGFQREYIGAILENRDGSYAVISRGDFKYFCLSQYTARGKETHFRKTEVGNYGIWNAARLEDGYIVQLGNYTTNEHSRIVKVDREGNITESFSYGSEEAYYYITDMIEFNGSIYLSAYAVPRLADEDQSAGGRYEIAGVLNYLFDRGIMEISSEDLTPMVRDNYTAILLACDPGAGLPRQFYSVEGSLGGKLALSDTGALLWNVESITTTSFSPLTSAFTIAGTSYVFRYTFDASGSLISQEKTGEIAHYFR